MHQLGGSIRVKYGSAWVLMSEQATRDKRYVYDSSSDVFGYASGGQHAKTEIGKHYEISLCFLMMVEIFGDGRDFWRWSDFFSGSRLMQCMKRKRRQKYFTIFERK
jgi:hypothetical protein